MPPFGCINVHASLLPRWRGAAPIQAAILHGDRQTGVTIMQMDPGIDTGAMLSQRALDILPDDTAGSLSARLAHLGAVLLAETLPDILAGKAQPVPQDEIPGNLCRFAKKGRRFAGFLTDSTRTGKKSSGIFTLAGRLHYLARPAAKNSSSPGWCRKQNPLPNPALASIADGLPAIAAAQGALALEVLQPAGKKAMDGKSFLAGAKNWAQ